jgi:type IV secretion system protein VirB11
MSHSASLRTKLACIKVYLDDPDITEIVVNQPGIVWLARKTCRHMTSVQVPMLTIELLYSLAELIASCSHQETGRTKPVMSATIPVDLSEGARQNSLGNYRVQIMLPPVVAQGSVGLCIRKSTAMHISLDDYAQYGAFNTVNTSCDDHPYSDAKLSELYATAQWASFLRGAVLSHKNIVISAGTNAGKTTLLNALLKEVPDTERIVTIEDTREINPSQPNCLHLLYSRGGLGASSVNAIDLLQAVLRLSPDRAIMGELRGEEAYAYLELLNSGHTGSMTTIHADSPLLMYERLAQMVMRFGSTLSKTQIVDYAKSLIHVVIQCKYAANGRRYISEIWYSGK